MNASREASNLTRTADAWLSFIKLYKYQVLFIVHIYIASMQYIRNCHAAYVTPYNSLMLAPHCTAFAMLYNPLAKGMHHNLSHRRSSCSASRCVLIKTNTAQQKDGQMPGGSLVWECQRYLLGSRRHLWVASAFIVSWYLIWQKTLGSWNLSSI